MKKVEIKSDHIGLYPRKGKSAKKNHVPLIYILTVPEGTGDLVINNEHPLSAPIRKQLSDGSPGGNWRYLVAKQEDALYIFGSMNVSDGNRLIFFPSNYNISINHKDKRKLLDHISFDLPPKMRSHYTFRDKSHRSNGNLKKINENLTLWFTLLINDLDRYIQLPNRTKLAVDWPTSDLERFSKDSVLANYNSKSIIEIPPIFKEPCFHQFDFFIGSQEVQIKEIPNLVLENYYDPNQPKNVTSGISITKIPHNLSLFIKIRQIEGDIPYNSLIMSSELI